MLTEVTLAHLRALIDRSESWYTQNIYRYRIGNKETVFLTAKIKKKWQADVAIFWRADSR